MTGAGEVLAAQAVTALSAIAGLNRAYDGLPVRASLPYAAIEIGPESDWSWKGGHGRELRLTATVHDAGERPDRLRTFMAAAEAALLALSGGEGWRVVNAVLVRRRTAQKKAGECAGVIEVRVRMERMD